MTASQMTIYDVMAQEERREKEKQINRAVGVAKRAKARTQEDKVIEFISRYGSITQRDANELGVYRLAARVFDINNAAADKYRGIHIIMEMDEAENQDGEKVKFGRYRFG